jgi:hypothetical protein
MKPKTVFRKDTQQTKALIKAGRVSAKTANRASRALGLTISYIKDGAIYEEKDGVIVLKERLDEHIEAPFEIKKGLILHAK